MVVSLSGEAGSVTVSGVSELAMPDANAETGSAFGAPIAGLA
jgi:hypothetical protein